jgi:hypothetical protein
MTNLFLQEFFFRSALSEINISPEGIGIDHLKGRCFHPNFGDLPLIFPLNMVNQIDDLNVQKTQEFFFAGMLTSKRDWISKYPNVFQSNYGRRPEKKYSFHQEYYVNMKAAKFGLSPVGDCPWSYRFFESVMCNAIPIIGDLEEDIFSNNFIHYRDSENKIFSMESCSNNKKYFLENHTLQGILRI